MGVNYYHYNIYQMNSHLVDYKAHQNNNLFLFFFTCYICK